MTFRTRYAALALSLALLTMPGLSCFVPGQMLGESQNECCRQMGPRCGSQEMSSPQSCCKTSSQQIVQPYIGSGEHFRIGAAVIVASFVSVDAISSVLVEDAASPSTQFRSPPSGLSETGSVLRI